MKSIAVSKASLGELKVIQDLGRTTFFETFAASNSEADMRTYLEANFSEEKIRTELNNAESLFFIAWDGEEAVGYLKINVGHAQTEEQGDEALEIERIYVKSSHHGKKVGQLLYEKALEVAKSLNKVYIWLGVWEENPRAIRFYEKNGFVAFDKHIFKMGADEQTDIMMKKNLK
ncbi:GNAT family N-acetyltransferase [Olivibacter jilunii]|uniref:GNAT family N-acetyltransferase n=1 Tax=Olivibacter jilunii TaxID=985016 RepID=UPI003F16D64A